MNSCNPVFMEIGARVGAKDMLRYYHKLGLYERTGVDLPGEANSLMHKLDKIGAVETGYNVFWAVDTGYTTTAYAGRSAQELMVEDL